MDIDLSILRMLEREKEISFEVLAEAIEQALLTAGMFGLGCGVAFARLRRLGGRPLALGLASWALVAAVALAASAVVS